MERPDTPFDEKAALEELVLRLPLRLRHAVALLEVGTGAESAIARAC